MSLIRRFWESNDVRQICICTQNYFFQINFFIFQNDLSSLFVLRSSDIKLYHDFFNLHICTIIFSTSEQIS